MVKEHVLCNEIELLSQLIDIGFEQNLPMVEMCAAYQALQWVLHPNDYERPSRCHMRPQPKLKLVSNREP